MQVTRKIGQQGHQHRILAEFVKQGPSGAVQATLITIIVIYETILMTIESLTV